MAKQIITIALACVYLTLSLAGPLAVFHRHQMPVQETSHSYDHEFHDSSCDKHVAAHIHLSDHCAACQFTAAKQSFSQYIWNTFDIQKSTDHNSFYVIFPSSQTHLSASAGRAPPSYLS